MQAECSDDVMKLNVKFNATFKGLIYSAGERENGEMEEKLLKQKAEAT